jgi:uncharacterized protein (TIGR03435 family)
MSCLRCRTVFVVVAGVFVGVTAYGSAQSPPAAEKSPAFEVASIRRNTTGDILTRSDGSPDGSYAATNISLRGLILYAYQLHPVMDQGRLLGGPEWTRVDRFDVVARAPENATPAETPARLRTLLAERFKLVVRTETREGPVYALLQARTDGKSGPALTPSALDCSKPGSGLVMPSADGPALDKQCGMRNDADARGGVIAGGGRTLAELARALTFRVNRPVIDRTGLTGKFDLMLLYTPEMRGEAKRDPSVPSGPLNDGTSIFTALQEQLGLKLESQRGPMDVFVIDRVEPLTPN